MKDGKCNYLSEYLENLNKKINEIVEVFEEIFSIFNNASLSELGESLGEDEDSGKNKNNFNIYFKLILYYVVIILKLYAIYSRWAYY